jgi:hypothetical protein
MLVTAAAVHLAAQLVNPPHGWLWLVVPMWTMLAGGILIVASRASRNETAS